MAGTDANGQFPPGTGELRIPMDPIDPNNPSDIAPIWNPEAFFNTMVVNGVTWPKLEVAPALYRFRLLNGTNSRFLNLSIKPTDAAANALPRTLLPKRTVWIQWPNGRFVKDKVKVKELNFFQIGSDQSLMPNVVAVSTGFATPLVGRSTISDGRVIYRKRLPSPQQALLVGPAMRADVLVDFRGLPNGTIITMFNTAPDAPFGGFPDVPADPSTTGQVMQFVVNTALLGDSPSDEIRQLTGPKWQRGRILNPQTAATSPEQLVLNPIDGNAVTVKNAAAPRQLALIEEESALICVDFDLAGNLVQVVGYTPVAGACQDAAGNVHPTALPMAPKTAALGTVDAAGQPTPTMWSDPVATVIDSTTGTGEQWDINNFTVDGHPIHVHQVKFKVLGRAAIGGGPSVVSDRKNRNQGVQPTENGWNDVVTVYPGEVASIAANFDINGLYVWHCHILEHEDNEMMVPLCVGQPGVDCTPDLF